MKRLNNPARFGFPVFVVLDEKGTVLYIQDSSFLEEGKEVINVNVDFGKIELFDNESEGTFTGDISFILYKGCLLYTSGNSGSSIVCQHQWYGIVWMASWIGAWIVLPA